VERGGGQSAFGGVNNVGDAEELPMEEFRTEGGGSHSVSRSREVRSISIGGITKKKPTVSELANPTDRGGSQKRGRY